MFVIFILLGLSLSITWWLLRNYNILTPPYWRAGGSKPIPLQHPEVLKPVEVLAERIPLKFIAKRAVPLANICKDLPAGMGLKGGCARKIFKVTIDTHMSTDVMMVDEIWHPGRRHEI